MATTTAPVSAGDDEIVDLRRPQPGSKPAMRFDPASIRGSAATPSTLAKDIPAFLAQLSQAADLDGTRLSAALEGIELGDDEAAEHDGQYVEMDLYAGLFEDKNARRARRKQQQRKKTRGLKMPGGGELEGVSADEDDDEMDEEEESDSEEESDDDDDDCSSVSSGSSIGSTRIIRFDMSILSGIEDSSEEEDDDEDDDDESSEDESDSASSVMDLSAASEDALRQGSPKAQAQKPNSKQLIQEVDMDDVL